MDENHHEERRERCKEALFVDDKLAELIQRVTAVMAIADELKTKDIIHGEKYDEIKAAKTNQEKMRGLFESLNSGGDDVKRDFYYLLEKHEPHLFKDLGGVNRKRKQDENLDDPVPSKRLNTGSNNHYTHNYNNASTLAAEPAPTYIVNNIVNQHMPPTNMDNVAIIKSTVMTSWTPASNKEKKHPAPIQKKPPASKKLYKPPKKDKKSPAPKKDKPPAPKKEKKSPVAKQEKPPAPKKEKKPPASKKDKPPALKTEKSPAQKKVNKPHTSKKNKPPASKTENKSPAPKKDKPPAPKKEKKPPAPKKEKKPPAPKKEKKPPSSKKEKKPPAPKKEKKPPAPKKKKPPAPKKQKPPAPKKQKPPAHK